MEHFPILRQWTDFEQLQQVEERAAELVRTVGYDPTNWGTTFPEAFERHAVNGLLWVATNGDRAVGFAVADIYGEALHIEEVDVDPEYQRHGIGYALVQSVVEEARKRLFESITLRTFHTTPWSIGLYQKAGFQIMEGGSEPYYVAPLVKRERQMGLEIADRCTMRLELGT